VPSVFSHAVAAIGIGACFYRPSIPTRIWITGAVCSMLPDLDVIGFRYGVHYGDFWGHRGFTHSLLFAALLATVVLVLTARHGVPGMGPISLWTFLFLAPPATVSWMP
jgi:inner membrane protein